MNFAHEYALLVAVAVPVITVLSIQAALFASGERRTPLFPGSGRQPAPAGLTPAQLAAALAAMPAASSASPLAEASNDDSFFRAA